MKSTVNLVDGAAENCTNGTQNQSVSSGCGPNSPIDPKREIGAPPAPLASLIERLEKASGPDRELGNEVLLACGWKIEEHGNGPDRWVQWVTPAEDDGFLDGDQPDPTSSIDAALTLVPEGWWWKLDQSGGVHGSGKEIYHVRLQWSDGDDERYEWGITCSAPLALCIAALKARSAA